MIFSEDLTHKKKASEIARRKLMCARSSLLLQHPFFATLALRLVLQEDKSCHTAWTDGKYLGYNPDYINVLDNDKLLGLTAHLVMHPACGHHLRRQERDFTVWNEACDYAINWILEDAGFTLPDSLHSKSEFRGMAAEDIYLKLTGDSDTQEDKEEDATEAIEPSDLNTQDQEQQEVNIEGIEKDMAAGEVRDVSSGTDSDESIESKQLWEETLQTATSQANEMGRLPEGIARLIKEQGVSQLSWQVILARFVERNSRSDYTWLHPNRRYLHLGLYFPSLLDEGLQQIVVAIDTSGSVTKDILESFSTELTAIMTQFPLVMHIFCCDAAVQSYSRFEKVDLPVTITLVGGGGTDFRPVFEAVAEKGIAPACLIYLSDMECELYPEKPQYPVLWVQSCSNGAGGIDPPFGESILMKN